ncbi:uncharacterized protein LOC133174561 [Saccostrea echinata]|uniref:uncharacterized protein LOC133174561 n=1 Tax=Saccostrea echinata TaxID=191078 RepID=UPI002A803810|nr:uncharacterized protein LOC133174561 [Saccostrea echinata]
MEMYNAESYRNRDILEVVIQQKEEKKIKDNEEKQKEQVLHMRRTPEIVSRPSSRMSSKQTSVQTEQKPKESNVIKRSEYIAQNNVSQTIQSLAILCLASSVVLILDIYVFLVGTGDPPEGGFRNGSLLTSLKQYEDVTEVFTAFSTLVMILSANCVLVCSMQCFIASKVIKTVDGPERAMKYFRECSSSRLVAVVGFFISFPVFLLTLMLCVVLRLKRTSALTAVVVLIIGTMLGLLCMVQNIYHWYDEMSSASRGLPAYKDSNKDDDENRDLNTLV